MKKGVFFLSILLIISIVINGVLVYKSGIFKEPVLCVGTYIAGDDKDDYEYLTLQDDNTYTFYTQSKGISDKGQYTKEGEYILLSKDGKEIRMLYEENRLLLAEGDSLVVYKKDSDIPTYVNVDEPLE